MNKSFVLIILLSLVFSACNSASATPGSPTPPPRPAGTLRVYPTRTATATLSEAEINTPTALPTASPTPVTHVVKKGEDLGGIAYRYHTSVSAIMAANPEVDPYLMSVGTELKIPFVESSEASGDSITPQPTPVSVDIRAPLCYATLDLGADCYALVFNGQSFAVENVVLNFYLTDLSSGEVTASISGTTLLNLIPAGLTQAVYVHFNGPLPQQYQVNAALSLALPYTLSDQRYLPGSLSNQTETLSADGLSAVVEGDITPANDSGVVWVAATAYDAHGRVVGLRRWQAGSALKGGETTHFSIRVYSSGAKIERIDLLAEARR
ncbi:MAG: LysM peptidoglycan-binding domain-containing protein [Anaerolineae bacterium]|nr:LysM peptidoglycan-binding domain-containing protein [Anaerolineae bacterium]